jgi:hypothetical protein
MIPRPLVPAAKLLVSAALVTWLARRYGGDRAFRDALSSLDAVSFLSAAGIVAAGLAASALRWRILLAARGARIGMARAVRLYFVGYFFNLFLPTAVGGDVARAIGAGRIAPLPVIAGTILVERIVGFGCLLAVGALASQSGPHLAPVRPSLWIAAFAYAAFLLVLARFPLGWGERPEAPRWASALARIAAQVRGTAIPPAALGGAIALSLAWQAALVLANAVLARGLGGVAPLGTLCTLVPVIQAVGMIPLSLGGLGVREAGYEFFFQRAGHDPAAAVALGAAVLGVTLAVALFGGILYLVRPLTAPTRS